MEKIIQPLQEALFDTSGPEDDRLKFQLEMLKKEVDIIDNAIARIDEIIQTHKYWTLLIWTGSIGSALGIADLKKFVILTAVPPIVTLPVVGRSMAPSRLSSVDLPQPDGPTIAMYSPPITSSDTPRTAWTGSPRCG
jgi:hypothetical protein